MLSCHYPSLSRPGRQNWSMQKFSLALTTLVDGMVSSDEFAPEWAMA